MSTLSVANISDGTTTVAASYVTNGSAKAWCYFNTSSSPTSITGSYNVSSLTDNGVGNTDVIITNSMSSTTSLSMQATSNNFQTHNSLTPSTTSFNVYTSNESGVAGDGSRNYLLVHGDLA